MGSAEGTVINIGGDHDGRSKQSEKEKSLNGKLPQNPDAERNCHSKIERTGLSYYQAASDAAGRDSQ